MRPSGGEPSGVPKPRLQSPAPEPAAERPKTGSMPRRPSTRRVAAGGERRTDRDVPMAMAPREKNPMVLIGAVGGGIFLLILIIAVAASGGSGASYAPPPPKQVVVESAPPPPPPPKAQNFVRNIGAVVFVCGGGEQHPDKEVVLNLCPKCSKENGFSYEDGSYVCSGCKAPYANDAIKCPDCGRSPRVTHLKKVVTR
jgi:hypothetical protein